jgi:hypoxanthine phosphoribosyltransferase
MCDKLGKILIGEQQMMRLIDNTAERIADFYKDRQKILLLAVLDGGLYFAKKLLETNKLDKNRFFLDSVRAQSYYDKTFSSGTVNLDGKNLAKTADAQSVLIVDDIYDTGRTLSAVKKAVISAGAKEVSTAVLLERRGTHEISMNVDFVAANLNDQRFVVGCGLDCKGKFRQLPYIAVLQEEKSTIKESS